MVIPALAVSFGPLTELGIWPSSGGSAADGKYRHQPWWKRFGMFQSRVPHMLASSLSCVNQGLLKACFHLYCNSEAMGMERFLGMGLVLYKLQMLS